MLFRFVEFMSNVDIFIVGNELKSSHLGNFSVCGFWLLTFNKRTHKHNATPNRCETDVTLTSNVFALSEKVAFP